jgi:type IV pilus assembly protein PilX
MNHSTLDPRASRRPRRANSRRRAQRGVTLLFALITLVALLLATMALVRSVDTSSTLMGNIGFKQDATVTAEQATRQATTWLDGHKTILNSDSSADGYYASTKEDGTTTNPPVDATGQQLAGTTTRQLIDWDGNGCSAFAGLFTTCLAIRPVSVVTSGSNSAQYIVFRLCSLPGDFSASGYTGTCAKPLTSSVTGASKKGSLSYADYSRFTGQSGPYYRIVTRVRGARNTTSFTETIIHF